MVYSIGHGEIMARRVLRFGLTLVVPAAPAVAGICSTDPEPRHDFQFMAGYSPVASTLIGTTTDRRFLLAGFGYSYRCWIWPNVSIA
jgi:hypothetical protein